MKSFGSVVGTWACAIKGPVAAVALVALTISGCAVVPGDKAYTMREQSAVKLPVKQESRAEQSSEAYIPENIKVQPITAELIINLLTRNKEIEKNKGPEGGIVEAIKKPRTTVGDYRVGPGDILSIVVWDHPELTTPAGQFRTAEQAGTVVSEDGTIFYPYVGVVNVGGKTTRQIRDILIARLSKYIEKVQLDVRMASYRSKRVYIVGEVTRPGLQEITDVPMTVLEAVNRAGGFSPEADHSGVLLTRLGVTYRLNIQSLYEEGRIDQNALLLDGDILNVPDRNANKIFVIGEVNKPGSFVMNKKRSTLAEALADSGYISQDRSNPKWIYLMRGADENPQLFHLDGSSPDALLLADKFPLQPRDIIYVDAADVVRWNRVVSNILPTAQTLYQLGNAKYPLFDGRNKSN